MIESIDGLFSSDQEREQVLDQVRGRLGIPINPPALEIDFSKDSKWREVPDPKRICVCGRWMENHGPGLDNSHDPISQFDHNQREGERAIAQEFDFVGELEKL